MKSSATMSIGEVAGRFGLATHVLRHWETMGLLSPERVTGGRRRYGRSDLYRVATILLAKEAGLALVDIRDILAATEAEKRRRIQSRHRDELVRRIEEMQAALEFIEGGLACQYEDITECPKYQSMVADRMRGHEPPPPPASTSQDDRVVSGHAASHETRIPGDDGGSHGPRPAGR